MKLPAYINATTVVAFIIALFTQIGNGSMDVSHMFPADWIPYIKTWDANIASALALWVMIAHGQTPAAAVPAAKSIIVALAVAGLIAFGSDARAADVAKATPQSIFTAGYPSTKCGMYYGLNTMGSAGAVNGAPIGTQVIQGDIGATLGYGCPLNADGSAFWFAEGMFDFANINGNNNGLALSGPAVFEQRFAFGSPISSMLNLFPSLSFPSLPSLPVLPAGVTAGPSYPYLFAAIHEQDISASVGLSQNRQWLISPGLGVGMLTRLSNNVVADVFAEWQLQSNHLCIGPAGSLGCASLGNAARVGFSLKY